MAAADASADASVVGLVGSVLLFFCFCCCCWWLFAAATVAHKLAQTIYIQFICTPPSTGNRTLEQSFHITKRMASILPLLLLGVNVVLNLQNGLA